MRGASSPICATSGQAEIKQGGGGAVARAAPVARQAAAARARATLLDPGTPYLELSQLAAYGVYEEQIPAAGILTGIGRVAARNASSSPTTPRSRAAPTTR